VGTAETLKAAATGQMTAREARNPFDTLAHQLESRLDEFAKMLGSRANAEAYIRVVKNAVLANPDLLAVDRGSLLLAAMRAAQDGLMPDGREAVLNIYNTKTKVGGQWQWVRKAQYLPMVGGLVKLLYASGEVTYIDAAVWYERDVFRFTRGDNVTLVHEPFLGDEDPGQIMGAYVVVKLKNGEIKREVMPRRDIEKVRAVSKAVDSEGNPTGPWKDWYDQQAIKSVIKRIYKQLPKTDRLERAIAHDNEEMHSAIAGQGSVADLALVTPAAAPAPAPAQALENSPSEVLEMPAPGAAEPVMAAQAGEQEQQQPQAGAIDPADRPDTGTEAQDAPQPQRKEPREHPKANYAALASRLTKAKDRDAADLVLDEARHLAPDQQKDLAKLADEQFPKG